ncbi:ankyrin repeat, SAM and basic leucine zipper domain-containing protein 1-like [Microplitis mediator]|uniref:ankyrin repeat, SAM and basic leucine zipper domain-containing protein 1-like n=1 Tax=Microplitis mediator TaxID=375433 RepID=UPI002554BE96|nr:ankyrin repeat, SAM and basic leucine zipper domain-containing protein 1-like [Microplitis mediator]
MDDWEKYFCILNSINDGETQKAMDIIDEFGFSSCPLSDDGYQLLTAAVEKDKVEMVAYLLRKNAKVNSDRDVQSPLQIAAKNNNTTIFKILLEHGAKIHYYNIHNDNSPIELAVDYNNIEIARLIVEQKNFGLKCDQSLLHTAVKYTTLEMVSLLLQIGADVNEYDDNRSAPIHHAVKAQNINILRLLLDYGADINAKNKDGDTPVCLVLKQSDSAYFSSSDIFELSIFGIIQNKRKLDILLDNDADINDLDILNYLPPIPHCVSMHFYANSLRGNSISNHKKSIIKHIVKLRSRNAHLSDNIKMFLSSLLEEKPMDDYKKMCELEMSKIITEKIPNSGLSLHNILSKNSNFLAAYAKNKNHETFIFSDEVSRRFPIYESAIKLRFSKGLARKSLLEQSTKIFHDLFPVASTLLSVAVDDVFECLDNNDLKHFLSVFEQDN